MVGLSVRHSFSQSHQPGKTPNPKLVMIFPGSVISIKIILPPGFLSTFWMCFSVTARFVVACSTLPAMTKL